MSEQKTKKMFINAIQPEEIRVALVEGGVLCDIDIEVSGKEQKKSSIYKGFITDIVPSLNAVFVKYSTEDKPGFLPFSEIAREYFGQDLEDYNRVDFKEVLKKGQELIVQVDKEERGSKGAALTTFISLAGCYLVLMPNNPGAGGISRRIAGEERGELRGILNSLEIPEDMGVIIRTAGVGQSVKDLKWDLDAQLALWHRIKESAKEDRRDKEGRPEPFRLHQESNVVVRSVRDHLKPDIAEIVVDEPGIYEKIVEFLENDRREFVERVKLYQGSIPLFNYAQIERQIESAFLRVIKLPSGGSIVFDHAEALTPIDVNSAKATKGGDIEETAFNTNLEAATEIARQLRLRDLGGLVVIDFIDMGSVRNQRAVEQRLREAMGPDRARVQVGRISRFGLLEMSRQRLRPALHETSRILCNRCEGLGTIASPGSLALSVMREVEEKILKMSTMAQLRIEVPVEVAAYLMNEKRDRLTAIEKDHHIKIILIPNQHMLMPNYVVDARAGDEGSEKSTTAKTDNKARTEFGQAPQAKKRIEAPTASTKQGKPANKATTVVAGKQSTPGLIKRLWNTLFGLSVSENSPQVSEETKPSTTLHVSTAQVTPNRPNAGDTRRTHRQGGDRRPIRHHSQGQKPQQHAHASGQKSKMPDRRPLLPKHRSTGPQEKPLLVPVAAIEQEKPAEMIENRHQTALPVGESVAGEQEVIVHLTPTKSEKSGRRRSHGGRQRYHKKRKPASSSSSPSPAEVLVSTDTQPCTEE
jgi:ribonuclease E